MTDSEVIVQRGNDPIESAIGVFTRQGYASTTVDDLADAVGLSRSTFFRRYGSKEDVVFADHEVILNAVEAFLATSPLSSLRAVCAAARQVFDHHVARRDISLARFTLLHDIPALRDRELIASHRYQRVFTQYLRASLPDDNRRDYTSIAFAAAVVAVHNAVLRDWLSDPEVALEDRLDAHLSALRRSFSMPRNREAGARVVVTVFEQGTEPAEVLDSIRSSLSETYPP